MHTWKDTGGRSSDEATAKRVPLAGRPSPTPISTPPRKAMETNDSWGTKDDAGTLTTSAVRHTAYAIRHRSHVISRTSYAARHTPQVISRRSYMASHATVEGVEYVIPDG